MGYYFLLQGIFPTQGSNLRRLQWQAVSLPLSHQGSPVSVHMGSQTSVPYSGDLGRYLEDREPTCPILLQAMNGFVKWVMTPLFTSPNKTHQTYPKHFFFFLKFQLCRLQCPFHSWVVYLLLHIGSHFLFEFHGISSKMTSYCSQQEDSLLNVASESRSLQCFFEPLMPALFLLPGNMLLSPLTWSTPVHSSDTSYFQFLGRVSPPTPIHIHSLWPGITVYLCFLST